MSKDVLFLENIINLSHEAREKSISHKIIGKYIDPDLNWIPKPLLGSRQIKLVLIGQDPTVKSKLSRKKIDTVLNLNKKGKLQTFVSRVCNDLGVNYPEEVYITNACKCFFIDPPTQIKEIDVLKESASIWLTILKKELEKFPEAMIVSLGEPVLKMLVKDGYFQEMKHYWGYHRKWKDGKSNTMTPILTEMSALDRLTFPFVHEPTMRGNRTLFYREKWDDYIGFILNHIQFSLQNDRFQN